MKLLSPLLSIFDDIFESNMLTDQNIKRIVNALATPLIKFIMYPICDGSTAKIEKKAPNI